MELVKSQWVASEDHVSLSMPISKIDRANRRVSGWATLDNVDRTDEVVTAEASKKAFAGFVGNIREMHQPIAAGHLISFKEDSFYDPQTKKFYRGIWVDSYVSEGAEDTWKKVLDGTLRGFSIGGKILEANTEFVPDLGKSIRFVTAYELLELSLVDSPANQLSNIFSVEKALDGSNMIKGMIAETSVSNVFWCATDEIVKTSADDTQTCLSCDSVMEQIGWFERGGDEVAKVTSTVAKFLRQKEDNDAVNKQVDTTAHGEGGVNMTDEIKKSADEVVEAEPANAEAVEAPAEVTPEEEQTVEVAAEGNEEAAVEGVDETPVEPDLEKMFDDLKDSVKDSVSKAVASVEDRLEKATEAFDAKTSELEKKFDELGERLESVKSERESVTKRLDALEGASAIKKSLEVETQPVEKVQKNGVWSGAILGE